MLEASRPTAKAERIRLISATGKLLANVGERKKAINKGREAKEKEVPKTISKGTLCICNFKNKKKNSKTNAERMNTIILCPPMMPRSPRLNVKRAVKALNIAAIPLLFVK